MRHILFILLTLFGSIIYDDVSAEIRNGYAYKLKLANESLKILDSLLSSYSVKDGPKALRERIKPAVKRRNQVFKNPKGYLPQIFIDPAFTGKIQRNRSSTLWRNEFNQRSRRKYN